MPRGPAHSHKNRGRWWMFRKATFDMALESVTATRGLILDLRDIPQGGSTEIAEPLLGKFISRRRGYQRVIPLMMAPYVKQVPPHGEWTYGAPMVVLVNRWTGSMAEGMAIGLDGMRRATIVGTRMAGLNGGVFNAELPNSRISFAYPGERLNHLNGTPRENFVPAVVVDFLDGKWDKVKDPILDAGYRRLVP